MKMRARTALFLLAMALSCCGVSALHASSVQIMNDFNFGTWSPLMSRWNQVVPVCVWDENARKTTYRVNVSGINSSNQFRLENDINEQLNYHVHWQTSKANNKRERLTANVDSQSVHRTKDNFRCENGPSGYLRITINDKDLRQASPGIYTDTLVVMISAL